MIYLTDCDFPCRRKNILHDIHEIVEKFVPRATAPHIRQINGPATLGLDIEVFGFII
jgi:hypothetical protein